MNLILVHLFLLCSVYNTVSINLRSTRSLPSDFPNSRRHSESDIHFPTSIQSLNAASPDLRLQENEANEEFPHTSHTTGRFPDNPSYPPPDQLSRETTLSPKTEPPTKQEFSPPPLNLPAPAWTRFQAEWNKIATLQQANRLSKHDKIHFLDHFRTTETLAAIIWPATFLGIFLLLLTSLALTCCCIKRPIYCFGHQLCDFSKDSATNHHRLKNIEMAPIIKPSISSLTEHDLDRLSILLHHRQKNLKEKKLPSSVSGADDPDAISSTGYASFSASPKEEKEYDQRGNPLSSTKVHVHTGTPKPTSLIEV